MDILTLGKMNAMSRDVDVTLEYLANATFQGLKDICDVQEGMQSALETTAQDAVNTVCAFGASGTSGYLYIGCDHNGQTGPEALNYNGWQCDWTVPADTKGIKFEIYGGGGSGFGACCCMMSPLPGGSGAYAVKHLNKENEDFTAGSTVYALCAGGTGCCWPSSHGNRGHTSYITGTGLSNFCALGGHTGEHHCQHWNCYTCCRTCFGCAAFYGADYGMAGRSGWRKSSQHSAHSMYSVAPGAPGPLGTGDYFSTGGCMSDTHSGVGPASPGTGANGARVSGGGCCCGSAGGGGAVVVTYWK